MKAATTTINVRSQCVMLNLPSERESDQNQTRAGSSGVLMDRGSPSTSGFSERKSVSYSVDYFSLLAALLILSTLFLTLSLKSMIPSRSHLALAANAGSTFVFLCKTGLLTKSVIKVFSVTRAGRNSFVFD